jgi:xylulokinase
VVVDHLPLAADALAVGVTAGRHADGHHAYLVAGWPGAGHLMRWLADRLAPGAPDTATGPAGREAWAVAQIGALVGSALPDHPAALIVEPYVGGRAAPAPDADRRVAVHGGAGAEDPFRSSAVLPTPGCPVTAGRGARSSPETPVEGVTKGPVTRTAGFGEAEGPPPAVVAQAALEGGAFHVRWMADAIVALAGALPDGVIAFGGGIHGPQWAELRAAVLPWPVRRCAEPEAVAVGAAMLAAPAAGHRIAPLPSEPVIVPSRVSAAYRRRYRDGFLPVAIAPRTAGPRPPVDDPRPTGPGSLPHPHPRTR